ncbi:MAG TPA: 16S rRNA (adenine(1518)-N(6)/adenine(1519)-N(6))-dimethyltransferase RsmA [Clostridia bacterium]|jgi:16S rRNA (adenine1518-N6/adenine1519-N6)-dimethyltransferase|nr:16S rRNA (adenine(1518)-N(6)/adenine(1519)-N(6))-dimethyltransferase RsmA [Clostridia bacterium]
MEIKNILLKNKFKFKKSLGQNFITDTSLLDAVVSDAGITSEDVVFEIGTGAGTLTRSIAKIAKKVISFDVDMSLQNILKETLVDLTNVELYFRDVMKLTDDDILDLTKGEFKIVANIPYNITTPLLMRFIESDLPLKSITVMVQEEIADRLTAYPGTPEYGAITIGISLKGDAKKVRRVNRHAFYPVPKVDSAIVRIDISNNKYVFKDKKTLKTLIRSGFHMRRKTFVNNVVSAFPSLTKEEVVNILKSLGYDENVRGEALATEDYIKIADTIFESKVQHNENNMASEMYEDDMDFDEEFFSIKEGEEIPVESRIDIIDYEK